jgi:hypothetical protein
MPSGTTEKTDLAALADDVAALRRDLAALMTHVRGGGITGAARETTAEIGAQPGGEAKELYARLAAEGERTAQTISRHIDEQPLTSVLLAFAAGFVAGRLLPR